MPGYVLGQIKAINDAAAFTAYQGGALPTVAQYGGKLVLNSSKIESGDGDWAPNSLVMLEFESVEQARKWYYSPEYQAVVGQRLNSADSGLIIIDGD